MTKTQMVSLPLDELNELLVKDFVVEEALKQGLISDDFVEEVRSEFEGWEYGLETAWFNPFASDRN